MRSFYPTMASPVSGESAMPSRPQGRLATLAAREAGLNSLEMQHERVLFAGVSSLFLLTLIACGSRTDTVSEEEIGQTDCAAEEQKVQDRCQKQCAPPPAANTPQSARPADVNVTACVDACTSEATKQCEATATCRCSQALTKLSSRKP